MYKDVYYSIAFSGKKNKINQLEITSIKAYHRKKNSFKNKKVKKHYIIKKEREMFNFKKFMTQIFSSCSN